MSRKSQSKRNFKRKKENERRKKLKSKKITCKNSDNGPFIMTTENPLLGVTEKERKELISRLRRQGKENVNEILKYLNEILRIYDPEVLIAILTAYGLTTEIDRSRVIPNDTNEGINQSHVELIQALSLQIPCNEQGNQPVTPDIIQNVFDKLSEVSCAFRHSRMDESRLDFTQSKKATTNIQEMVRNHTQLVRNWGYYSQVVSISKELYSHFDTLLEERLGFSASIVIDIFCEMIRLIESRVSKRLITLRGIKSEKKPLRMLNKYRRLIGEDNTELHELLDLIKIETISRNELFLIILGHFDQTRPTDYYFSYRKVSEKLGINEEVVKDVFKYFSFTPGELAKTNKEFFFLDNPVWKKPVIHTKSGFYCPMPQIFFNSILSIFDEIIEGIDKKSLHIRRATFLEKKIEDIVKRRFPSSQVFSNIEWESNGKKYETDLLVNIDSYLIIIEAKSHKISKSALRGAPDRIKRHVQELLIKPSLQSSRLEQEINSLRQSSQNNQYLLENQQVNTSHIKKILRVSVSLEDFAILQTNLKLLNDTDWVPEDFIACPTICLADFETLFDLLEHPIQIIHYLTRRAELEEKVTVIGDELDFMGLYLETQLNIEMMINDPSATMVITGMSRQVDKYYISKDNRIKIDKPQPKISDLFKNIFSLLESRMPYRWTEIGSILNRFPYRDQVNISNSIKKLAKSVNKNWTIEKHKNIAIYSPPESSQYAIAFVLFKDTNFERRYEFIESAAEIGLEPQHVRYCLVISINIDTSDPYHAISLAEKVINID
jgi:hypothetical protein